MTPAIVKNGETLAILQNGENLFSCNFCDKAYDKKASFYSHMRMKHPSIKKKNNSEDSKENETQNEEGEKSVKNVEEATRDIFWYENEEEDIPPMSVSPPPNCPPSNVSTQELEKLLPRPESRDSILSQIYEAERLMEVRDIEPDWFNKSFDSVYAENLRRNSAKFKCGHCEKTTNEMNKMRKHLDDTTVKTNIFFKKTEAQKLLLRREIKKMSDKAKEETECRQCPMRASVEEDQAKSIEAKDKELEELKKHIKMVKERNLAILVDQKKMKREKNEMVKKEKVHETDLKELRNINGEIIKSNATYKIKLKMKDDLIKSLKELSGIEESDEEVEEESISMDKDTSGSVCLICDKKFSEIRALEQHMQAKHKQGECPICDKVFRQGRELENHTDECMKSMDEGHECPNCRNKFLTKKSLKSHIAKNHMKVNQHDDKYTCGKCEMIFNSKQEMMSHVASCKQKENNMFEKSKEVCRHWRRGNCNKGDSCGFSHVGHQLMNSPEHRFTKETSFVTACKHGPSCAWLAMGSCSYFHKNVGVQKPWNHKGKDKTTTQISHPLRKSGDIRQSGRSECKYGARCNKVPNCTFLHSLLDFPTLQMGNQQHRKVRNSNRRQ